MSKKQTELLRITNSYQADEFIYYRTHFHIGVEEGYAHAADKVYKFIRYHFDELVDIVRQAETREDAINELIKVTYDMLEE